jgi:hypothetical protein
MTLQLKEQNFVLRAPAQASLETIGHADILVGIPCYNNEDSIAQVVQTVSAGLVQHYPTAQVMLLVADGGSTDDTRERALKCSLPPQQHRLVTIYRGIGGKGSALRTIFAAAVQLGVKACICVDADLRSITPEWIAYFLEPLLVEGYEFVAPLYGRYKYDGTITNNLVYCLTRALYGKRIRQPIGGDFAFSQRLAHHYLEQAVWTTDIARFGIDIWMTLGAIVAEARICQTNLGVKLHDAKDPALTLGPMFQQVCSTLFTQIEQDVDFWSPIVGSETIPTFGLEQMLEPEPIAVNQSRLVREFKRGFEAFHPLYQLICSQTVYQALQQASESPADQFEISGKIWIKLLYEFLVTYHQLQSERNQLLAYLTPLYLGQVASFMTRTRHLDFDAAEAVIEGLANQAETMKPYLLELWQQPDQPNRIASIQAALSLLG